MYVQNDVTRHHRRRGAGQIRVDPLDDLLDNPQSQRLLPTSRITFRQLIRNTDKGRKDRALAGMRVFYQGTDVIKPVNYPKGFSGQRLVRFRVGQNKVLHFVNIHFFNYRKLLDSKAWVHCSCQDFMYRNEYLLSQLRATEQFFVENRPPLITNPDMIPYVCKHIIRALPKAFMVVKEFARAEKYRNMQLDLPQDLQELGNDDPGLNVSPITGNYRGNSSNVKEMQSFSAVKRKK